MKELFIMILAGGLAFAFFMLYLYILECLEDKKEIDKYDDDKPDFL